jgi:hypothetical protein
MPGSLDENQIHKMLAKLGRQGWACQSQEVERGEAEGDRYEGIQGHAAKKRKATGPRRIYDGHGHHALPVLCRG